MAIPVLRNQPVSPLSPGRLLTNCTILLGLLPASYAGLALSATPDDIAETSNYSPYAGQLYPRQLLWGDTHLHTAYSTDAALLGNRLGPDEAYRLASGGTVVSSTGQPVKLIKPLDFLVVSDHSENLGLAPMMAESNKELLASSFGRQLSELFQAGELLPAMALYDGQVVTGKDPLPLSEPMKASMWSRMTTAAESHNVPGLFSALIGYEWTGTPAGSNLHRNVIYRDGKDLADALLPFTAFDSTNPQKLWEWMAGYEAKTGGRVLAIPHNGNLSNGLMFADSPHGDTNQLDSDYARRRMRWEPIYEVTQIKGDSESHPLLSPADEFSDFETWDTGSFVQAKKPGLVAGEYAREALKRGLAYQAKIGTNPFMFGMIGSTDSHTSLPTSREENFFGKAPLVEPSSNTSRFATSIIGLYPDPDGIDYTISHARASASGLTAVWADENTRRGVWDALYRKEVYATTGTRIAVRLFAGWNLKSQDLGRSDLVSYAYSNAVPMGGQLTPLNQGDSPALIILAQRDPDGANLDRIQVIKGWVDAAGTTHERVYDVAASGHRVIGPDGRCHTPVGNTVDRKAATYNNTIGAPELIAHWRDPDFDRNQHAFYYARILEIPTPRWTTYDAARFDIEIPADVPHSIQERAYTSPVWYTPDKDGNTTKITNEYLTE
jgi:hypothetical protein